MPYTKRGSSWAFAFLLAAATTATSARANFIFATCTSAPVTLTTSTSSVSGSIVCPQFDPSMGNLFQYSTVALTSNDASFSGTFTLRNDSGAAIIGGSVPGPDFSLTFNAFPGQSVLSMGMLSVSPGPANLAIGGSQTFTMSPGGIPIGRTGQTSSLSSYIGTGTFLVPYTLSYRTVALLPGTTLTELNATVRPGISIVYEFTTPEPSTLTMAALPGLALLALRMRKSRRDAKIRGGV